MTKFSENFTYKIDGKKVASMGDFYFFTQGNTYDIEIDGLEVNAKRIDNLNNPFFLDEVVSNSFSPRNKDKTEEELVDILKRYINIGAPDWQENNTGGSVFERVQDTTKADYIDLCSNIKMGNLFTYNEIGKKQDNKNDLGSTNPLANTFPKQFNDKERLERTTKKAEKYLESLEIGKKESKTVEKAPIFTYCKQMKNAVEALALRSLYGHNKYEKGDDWENFSRVENGEFEYSNAEFRHSLEIGEDEDEKQHLIAGAWNSVARLELYLRKNK